MNSPKTTAKRSHKKKVSTPMLPSQAPQLPVPPLPELAFALQPDMPLHLRKAHIAAKTVIEPSIYSELDYTSEAYEEAAEKRWEWNNKIINRQELMNLMLSSVCEGERATIFPRLSDFYVKATNKIDFDKMDAIIDRRISEIMSAFELLPHSKRFLDLVFNIYSALMAEADGLGEVIVTNTSFLDDQIKQIAKQMDEDGLKRAHSHLIK